MYTEDDEKVKVKETNSKNDYNDFYTSFNEMEEDEDHDKKKNKNSKSTKTKKQEEPELKEESDYSNFYNDVELEEEKPADNKDNGNKKIIIRYSIIAIALIILIIVAIIIIGKIKPAKKVVGDIELNTQNITLSVGGSDFISYKVIETESTVSSTFTSSDTNVAMVDENGKITAVGPGEATITIHYIIDEVERDKQCVVKVEGPQVNEDLALNLKYTQGKENSWTNKDVVITVEPVTELGVSTVKYALNCEGTCNYVDVTDNKITINNNGTTKVTVKVTDIKNKEVVKETTVKIDKEAPNITLNSDKNITSNKDVEVCATCSDDISGCKQAKVCKKFTSTKKNQTITVTDNAGNTKKSAVFNVTINKIQEPCSLKVSNDGTVTATLRESASYYGFNSSYSGSNELSKKVDITVSRTDKAGVMAGAKVVTYYVKNKNGSGGMCYATVVKECTCNDANSTDPNCAGTCTFRIN